MNLTGLNNFNDQEIITNNKIPFAGNGANNNNTANGGSINNNYNSSNT